MVDATQLSHVEAQAEVVRGLVAGLDPDWVPLPDAPKMWQAFDAIARAAGAAQVLLARRVEESSVWQAEGCRSAAEYLARRSGGSVRGAREVLRASKTIGDVPVVEAALRGGRLSVAQAAMVTDAARHDPVQQARLVDTAGRSSLAELAEECGRVKAAADPDPEETYERIRANRRLRQRTDGEGAWCLSGRGTPDDGALFRHVLEPLVDELFDAARREGRHEHRDAYLYDALIELLNRSLGDDVGGGEVDTGAEPDDGTVVGAQRGSTRPKRASRNVRHLALLRLDVTALQRGKALDGELCEITGVGPIPVGVARRLLGDAVLKLVLTKGVDVANVTHLGRGATVAQRMALLWQSPSCSNEACPHSFVQIDHREPWAETHHTVLGELDPLCPHDHRLKTYQGWSLVPGTGRRAFVPPTDTRHPRNAEPRPTAAPAAA